MIWDGLRFQDPKWLALIIPAAILVILNRRQNRFAVTYSSLEGLSALPTTWMQKLKRLLPLVWFLGLLFLALAMARPQEGRQEFRIRTEGIAIQMVIDRSGSMDALDFSSGDKQLTRIDAVKEVIEDFVAGTDDLSGRPDDLIGLIAFGGFAEGKCPLTLDHGALLQVLKTIDTPKPIVDARGRLVDDEFFGIERSTAIGDALALGVQRVKEIESESRVLILLSDGENTAGEIDPLQAAEAAAAFGIKVYAVGVGSTGIVPIRTTDTFGNPVLDRVQVRLDERLLRSIAETTNGQYFNAKDQDSLTDIYATIDELEKTETESVLYTEYRELYHWALIPGCLLLLLHLLLVSTRFRSLP